MGKIIGLALLLVFGSVVISLGLVYLGTAVGWAAKPAQIYSVKNVEAEYAWFYEQRRGLEANANNLRSLDRQIETLRAAHGTSKIPLAEREQLNQLLAARAGVEQAYNSNCAAYQARHDNVFHNLVAPSDIPRSCGYA